MTGQFSFRPYVTSDRLHLKKLYATMPRTLGHCPPTFESDVQDIELKKYWEGGAVILGLINREIFSVGTLARLPPEEKTPCGEIRRIRVLPHYREFEGMALRGLEMWAAALGLNAIYLDLSAWANVLSNPQSAEGYVRTRSVIAFADRPSAHCYKKDLH